MRLPASCVPLGLGCAAFGNLYEEVPEAQVEETFQAAWDIGIRLYDVAPHYGLGLAEERLGRLLRSVPRDEAVVSSKVGRLLIPNASGATTPDSEGFTVTRAVHRQVDFSREGVRRSVEDSLRRLGLDRLDIALIHDPDDAMDVAVNEAFPALDSLRAEGVVGAIGVGTKRTVDAERFVRETDTDVVLIAGRYSLLDRSAAMSLLPACRERGVDVLVGGVLNSGILGMETPDDTALYEYGPVPPDVLERARALAATCRAAGVRLPVAATAFPLTHPAVTSVLTGARSAAEVREAHAAVTTPIPPELLAAITRGETCAS